VAVFIIVIRNTNIGFLGRSHANENKVPTLICYSRQTGAVASWGFSAETEIERDNGDLKYAEWFKVLLDENMFKQMKEKDPENTPESIYEVEMWFLDYLKLLYRHIETRMANTELPSENPWKVALVEFIATVPSTWSPHTTVDRFKQLLVRAGFDQYPNHSVSVGFTEAEAAAVSTSVEAPGLFKEKDVILVCDMGGGTTDINVLEVEKIEEEDITLKQLDVVQGRNIGSAQIDRKFEALAYDRVSRINLKSPESIDWHDVAWHMMKSREFQNAKCDHGSPDDTPIFAVPVPKLSPFYQNDELSVINGAMQFTRSELRQLFDIQIGLLYELIDKQLQRFQGSYSLQYVSHLILSGGLGNSLYVQDQLRKRYGFGTNPLNYSREIRVQVAPEPQLAVCKGVVMNRMRKFKTGKDVLGWRCARASYGTICKVPYDPANALHNGRPRTQDPFTGIEYLANAIEWFIHKGSPVNSDVPISKHFTRKLYPDDLNRTFPTSIVVSHVDWESLPMQLNEDAQILCRMESDLSLVEERHFKLVGILRYDAKPELLIQCRKTGTSGTRVNGIVAVIMKSRLLLVLQI
jgi:hypothetical protein